MATPPQGQVSCTRSTSPKGWQGPAWGETCSCARRRPSGRGVERATLWVLETNQRARRFYEREGWAWDGTTSIHQVEGSNLPIVRYALDLPQG